MSSFDEISPSAAVLFAHGFTRIGDDNNTTWCGSEVHGPSCWTTFWSDDVERKMSWKPVTQAAPDSLPVISDKKSSLQLYLESERGRNVGPLIGIFSPVHTIPLTLWLSQVLNILWRSSLWGSIGTQYSNVCSVTTLSIPPMEWRRSWIILTNFLTNSTTWFVNY